MKSRFTLLFLALGLLMTTSVLNAQNQDLKVLEAQAEVLKLNSKLLDKKIDLEKERQSMLKIAAEVEDINKKSNKSTDKFTTSDPQSTINDAKKTMKILQQAEAANKELDNKNKKIAILEDDVKKYEAKISRLKYILKFETN